MAENDTIQGRIEEQDVRDKTETAADHAGLTSQEAIALDLEAAEEDDAEEAAAAEKAKENDKGLTYGELAAGAGVAGDVIYRHETEIQKLEREAEEKLLKTGAKKGAKELLKKEAAHAEKGIFRQFLEDKAKDGLWDALKGVGKRVVGRTAAAEELAGGEEALATGAEATGGVAAAPAVIITAAVAGATVVGYGAYKNNQAQNQLDEVIRTTAQGHIVSGNEGLRRYHSLTGTLLTVLPEINGAAIMGKNAHLEGNNVIADDQGHRLDMTDQRNRDALRIVLEAKRDAQQKIIDNNRSPATNWIPDAVYLGNNRSREKAARAEQAPYIAALDQLHQYEEQYKARAHGTTFGVGDSFACGLTEQCDEAVNLAIVGSHITTQGGKKGALEQLDEVMARAKRGDKVLFHTGRNDLGAEDSPAYQMNMERIAREMKALQDMGVEVVWVGTPAGGDKDAAAVQKMEDYQKKVALAHGIQFIQVNGTIARAADGVHPKDYHHLASVVAEGTGITVKQPKLHPEVPSHKANADYAGLAPPAAQPHPGTEANSTSSLRGTEPHRTPKQMLADIDYWAEKLHLSDLDKKYGLQRGFLKAVMTAESQGDPHAVSNRGAKGLFQFMPDTATEYGLTNAFDPQQSAEAAGRKYSNLSKRYNGDVPLMLAGYNWGEGNLEKHGKDLSQAPVQTKNYIAEITDLINQGNPQFAANNRQPARRGNRNNLLPQEVAEISPTHPVASPDHAPKDELHPVS